MTDVARSTEVAAVDSPASVQPKRRVRGVSRPMIDRYHWYEVVAIYAGIALFLFFVLAPFIEGFLVSLKPLAQLFSTPYSFIPKVWSFDAYVTMWTSVPALGMHIFNSFFISTVVTIIAVAIVVPAAYAFARFRFAGSGLMLAGGSVPAALPAWLVAVALGALLGTQLGLQWLPAKTLRRALGVVLLVAAAKLLFA